MVNQIFYEDFYSMEVIKTSISHPLRIDEVKVPGSHGVIGMTLCPGKKIKSIISGVWNRDLDIDLDTIKTWGASALVTLMEDHEFKEMSVTELPDKARFFGIAWYYLPIKDVCAPGYAFIRKWKTFGPQLRQVLKDGGRILIHCRGGLGRTGTVAAQLLVELGMKPKEAISKVRKARPGAIETRDQESYVYRCQAINDRLSYEHFAGCLLGGAVGDALGAPVEFSPIEAIRKRYGEHGISDYDAAYGRKRRHYR